MANDNFEMEDLDSINLDSFGISSTETLSSEDIDFAIFGGSPSADPNDVKEIEKTDPKEEKKKEEKKEEKKISKNDVEKEVAQALLNEEENDDEGEDTTEEKKEEGESEENTFESLSKDLFELGIFTPLEDDEESPKTPEEFRDRFIKEVNVQANQQVYNFLMQKHGEEGIKMFDSVFVKGISPKEFLQTYTQIESLKNIDISKEENQEKVYKVYYRKLGWSDEKIDAKIQKLKDYGDLEEEASLIHEKVIESEQRDFAEKEKQKEQEAQYRQQEQYKYSQDIGNILNTKLKTKDFDGIPINDKIVREAYENLVVEKYQLPNGEKLTEYDKTILDLRRPENYEKRVKLWLLLQNDLDLTKVKTKAISQESGKLFSSFAQKEKVAKRTNQPNVDSNFTDFLK